MIAVEALYNVCLGAAALFLGSAVMLLRQGDRAHTIWWILYLIAAVTIVGSFVAIAILLIRGVY